MNWLATKHAIKVGIGVVLCKLRLHSWWQWTSTDGTVNRQCRRQECKYHGMIER